MRYRLPVMVSHEVTDVTTDTVTLPAPLAIILHTHEKRHEQEEWEVLTKPPAVDSSCTAQKLLNRLYRLGP
jgi:hypothetical protein